MAKNEQEAHEVVKPILLFVEGKDEAVLLRSFIGSAGLTQIQIVMSDGGPDIANKLGVYLKAINAETIRAVLIIRDAEEDYNSALNSTRDLLTRHKIPAPQQSGKMERGNPISGGFFIASLEASTPGCLEDICLKSKEQDDLMKCVDSFLECICDTSEKASPPRNLLSNHAKRSKARIQSYLAALHPENVSLGVAGQKGSFNYSHACFEPIRKLLIEAQETIL